MARISLKAVPGPAHPYLFAPNSYPLTAFRSKPRSRLMRLGRPPLAMPHPPKACGAEVAPCPSILSREISAAMTWGRVGAWAGSGRECEAQSSRSSGARLEEAAEEALPS